MATEGDNRGRTNEKETKKAKATRDPSVSASEKRLAKLELGIGDTSDRVRVCEEGVETLEERVGILQSQVVSVGEDLQAKLFQHVNTILENWRIEKEEYQGKVEALATQVEELQSSLEKTNMELAKLQRAKRGGEIVPFVRETPRVHDVPKPKEFKGSRNAEEIDNFLWHMERYFEAIQLDDASKVSTASLYLVDLAATWWRRKYSEMTKGLCKIDSWEAFVVELKRQFYPANANHEARKKIKELKHGSSLHDYVRDFSALMLQLPDISEAELFFNFMDGLKPWAKLELERRDVKDTATAMTIADTLTEYSRGESSSKPKAKKENSTKGGGVQEPKGDKPKSGGGKPFEKKTFQGKPKNGCFLCGGPHWSRDCPKRNALNALLEEKEEEATIGCIKLLGALKAKPTTQKVGDRTLMYVNGKVNGKNIPIMVDTGATHNFIQPSEARRLGLKAEKSKGWLKTVNTEAKPLRGSTRRGLTTWRMAR